MYYYLDEAQHTVSACYEYTQQWVLEKCPELYEDIPSPHSFYRRVHRELPEPLKVLAREGEKAFRDRCAPYISRVYDDMESNEYWVADTHTLDVISNDEDGRQHCLYLMAFFDACSGIFTGCHIADQPSNQATLVALRRGMPSMIINVFGPAEYASVNRVINTLCALVRAFAFLAMALGLMINGSYRFAVLPLLVITIIALVMILGINVKKDRPDEAGEAPAPHAAEALAEG